MGTTWCYFVNMRGLSLACVILCAGLVLGQDSTESSPEDNVTTSSPVTSTTTTEAPVVIVKQVNEINEDGSYTVGYEASDGSFRLETRMPREMWRENMELLMRMERSKLLNIQPITAPASSLTWRFQSQKLQKVVLLQFNRLILPLSWRNKDMLQ